MTYRFGDSSVIQGISEADLAEGYRVLDVGSWRAAAENAAATVNVGIGNLWATNAKAWSFADNQYKRINASFNEPFTAMPVGALTTAKISFMWGTRVSRSGDDCRFLFTCAQSETDDNYIDETDSHIRNLASYLTETLTAETNAYMISTITANLSGAGWTDKPTFFGFGRNGPAASDTIGAAIIVYGIQILVK